MNGILQIQMCGQSCQVVGIMVHVVAFAGLGRAAMTAPVVGDHTKTLAEEEEHLSVPIVRRERPAVTEHDRLTFTPVLVVDLRSVFGCDRTHTSSCPVHNSTKPNNIRNSARHFLMFPKLIGFTLVALLSIV